jgi:hypothetical protein
MFAIGRVCRVYLAYRVAHFNPPSVTGSRGDDLRKLNGLLLEREVERGGRGSSHGNRARLLREPDTLNLHRDLPCGHGTQRVLPLLVGGRLNAGSNDAYLGTRDGCSGRRFRHAPGDATCLLGNRWQRNGCKHPDEAERTHAPGPHRTDHHSLRGVRIVIGSNYGTASKLPTTGKASEHSPSCEPEPCGMLSSRARRDEGVGTTKYL